MSVSNLIFSYFSFFYKFNFHAIKVRFLRQGEGVLLNYQLVMNLLIRKFSNLQILETRLRFTQKLFTQVRSIEGSSLGAFRSRPSVFNQSHEHNRKTVKLYMHLNPKTEISVNRLRMSRCLMPVNMGFILNFALS